MRGRKPVPTVLKILRGNPGKRAINRDEPRPGALALDCPEIITAEEARAEWTRTIVPAIRIRQITGADRLLAIAHCELWSTWREQLAEAARHPHIVAVGKSKHPAPNPGRQAANKTLQMLIKIDSELGLSPVSRARVAVRRDDGGSDDAELDRILAIT